MGDGGDGRLLGIAAGDLSAFFARAWQAGRGALYPIAPRMEDASCVTLLVFFRVSGGANRSAVASLLAGQPKSIRAARQAGEDRCRDLVGQHLRRGGGGLPAQSIPEESREPRQDLSARSVGLFAASQLFLRVDDLGRLCDFRAGLAVGMAGTNFASADALFSAWHDRHRGNGSPGAADAGRGISRLPENDEHVYSVVSQERTRLNCLSNNSRFLKEPSYGLIRK